MTIFPQCIESFFSALTDSAYLLDIHGRIKQVNPIALNSFNSIQVGSSIDDLAETIGWSEAVPGFEQCRDEQRTVFQVVRDASGMAMFEVTCTPIFIAGDQPEAVLIQVANVVGEALMDERYRVLSRVFNSMIEGVLTLDMKGRITGMNRSAAALLRVREEDVHLEPVEKIFCFRDAEVWEVYWKAFEQCKRIEVNADLELPGDRVLPCSISLSPLDEDQGSYRGFAVTLKDRSAQIEIQHNLIQMEKLNSLGKLVAGFAHELNNPLTSVIGFAQLLLASRKKVRDHDEIAIIHQHALRCKKIIDNLLAFARKSSPQKVEVDINEIIVNTAELLKYQFERNNIQIHLELDDAAPFVRADPSQMQQVFVNLLENSRYELANREEPGEIQMSTRVVDNRVVIKVADNGPGFTAENLDRIFDPFFTTKPGGEGTGLGLSLSYGFMQEHGGTLNARNLPAGGAEFEISIPKLYDKDAKQAVVQQESLEKEKEFHGSDKKVLVVDDEEQVCHLIGNLLSPLGIEVMKAHSGLEALSVLKQFEFDLILLDIRLPDSNGAELKEQIMKQRPEYGSRILLLTGDTIKERRTDPLEAVHCHDEVITKPFNIHVLKQRIFDALTEKTS
ncbi:MAG: ATP-binding protein [Planctomycetota bacterium]